MKCFLLGLEPDFYNIQRSNCNSRIHAFNNIWKNMHTIKLSWTQRNLSSYQELKLGVHPYRKTSFVEKEWYDISFLVPAPPSLDDLLPFLKFLNHATSVQVSNLAFSLFKNLRVVNYWSYIVYNIVYNI